jgi:hypothetical protein
MQDFKTLIKTFTKTISHIDLIIGFKTANRTLTLVIKQFILNKLKIS